MCSLNLVLIFHKVSPIEGWLQLVRDMHYMTLDEERVKLDLTRKVLLALLTVVVGLIWVHVWQRW